jgi:hypothetical protein
MSQSEDDQKKAVRVLICGPRDFVNGLYVFGVVVGIVKTAGPNLVIIEGEANGVDTLARLAAEKLGIPVDPYPADWSKGRSAGPVRNRRMLDEGQPDYVVAIGNGAGTTDMIRQTRARGIPVVWRAYWWNGRSAKP